MITKNYKSIFSLLTAFTIALFVMSCDDDNYTGYSTLDPTNPVLGITVSATNVVLIEDGSEFEFEAQISLPQLVDVKLYAFQAGGDADSDDYNLDGILIIPAGSTSAKGTLTILQDDVIEETETLKIQIGDQRTANTDNQESAFMDFQILNYTDGDLDIQLGWDMSEATTDNSGNDISSTDFADMRLLVSTTPDNQNVVLSADGGSFEHLVMPGSFADGDYYVVSDFYAANGDIVRDINLHSTYNQIGVITDAEENFDNAISNASICPNNFFVLTKITKAGESYTITREGINNFVNLTVSYSGTDAGYDSQVTTGVDCSGKVIAGLNAEWMFDFWGEVIEEEGTVYWTVDAAGVVTIESQYIFTTSYSGSLYPYTVSATGTYNEATGELYLQYYLDQEGFSPSNWAFDNGYQDTPYFEATLTAN